MCFLLPYGYIAIWQYTSQANGGRRASGSNTGPSGCAGFGVTRSSFGLTTRSRLRQRRKRRISDGLRKGAVDQNRECRFSWSSCSVRFRCTGGRQSMERLAKSSMRVLVTHQSLIGLSTSIIHTVAGASSGCRARSSKVCTCYQRRSESEVESFEGPQGTWNYLLIHASLQGS